MTASPLLKGLLAGLRKKRGREGGNLVGLGCCGFEAGDGWERELREWEERGSKRKEAREKDERVGVEGRLGSLERVSEEGGDGGGFEEEPKKRRRGGEGVVVSFASSSLERERRVARPLSVEQLCQIEAARALKEDAIFLLSTSKRLEALEQSSQLLFRAYNSPPQTHLSSPLLDLTEQHLSSAVTRVQDGLAPTTDGGIWVRYSAPESLRTPLESLGMVVIVSDDLMHVTARAT